MPGELLFSITCDQYKTSFNQNPASVLQELKRDVKNKNGLEQISSKVLAHYKEIYNFSIPGYGKMNK